MEEGRRPVQVLQEEDVRVGDPHGWRYVQGRPLKPIKAAGSDGVLRDMHEVSVEPLLPEGTQEDRVCTMFSLEKHTAEYGDVVIIYETHERSSAIRLERGEQFQCPFGGFFHEDFAGKAFGSKIPTRSGTGFVYMLRPSPELWTVSLSHRTQILYAPDISMVVATLGLKPGSRVVEAGTGSGSLSTSIVRAVMPTGHLFTYEFNEFRAQTAREEFARNGLSRYVTVFHRDACADGFDLPDCSVDAVFLDMPAPWEALEHAARILKPNSMFCGFSPCIEQVDMTCRALRESCFTDIVPMETLERRHYSDRAQFPLWTGKNIRIEEAHAGRTRARHQQEGAAAEEEDEEDEPPRKVAKGAAESSCAPSAAKLNKKQRSMMRDEEVRMAEYQVMEAVPSMKGHTGYLTFARKLVAAPVPAAGAAEKE